MKNILIVLTWPTGVGKTELSLRLAERLNAPIISADSRQFHKDIPIGSTAPSGSQQQRVQHYIVGMPELTGYYSSACFEADVPALLERLYLDAPAAVMTGGSNDVCRRRLQRY